MTDFSECDRFSDDRRQICRGERLDLPLDGTKSINGYRALWGLAPIRARANGLVASHDVKSSPMIGPAGQPAANAPSLLQQVATFASALTSHLKDGLTKCDTPQIEQRLTICQQCPEFTGQHCRNCGCACNSRSTFFNKLAWRSETCPLGRW